MQELPHALPDVPRPDTQDGGTVRAPAELAVAQPRPPGELTHLADQSVEVLDLYAKITTLVQHHLGQLNLTAEQLRDELATQTAQVANLQAEQTGLQQELDTMRQERDTLRQELEDLVRAGLERRRELAGEIEQLERAREEATQRQAAARRRWWQFWQIGRGPQREP
jgi:septal ring factor EnvC (AmiA/AmiB activator)